MTPFFVGAHPATVHDGPNKGFRLLGGAEDLARQIMTSLNDAERRTALIANRSFGEIVASPQREQDLGQPRGLEISAMDGPTRQRVEALMDTFLASLTPDLVASQKQRVMQQGLDRFRFAWAGSLVPGEAYYFRVHGPAICWRSSSRAAAGGSRPPVGAGHGLIAGSSGRATIVGHEPAQGIRGPHRSKAVSAQRQARSAPSTRPA